MSGNTQALGNMKEQVIECMLWLCMHALLSAKLSNFTVSFVLVSILISEDAQ